MPGPATTSNYTALSNFVDKTALEVAKPLLTISKFGKKVEISTRSSKTIKFKRIERLAPLNGAAPATVRALVEGVVPTAVNPTETNYTATCYQYGNLSQISDQAGWINEVDVDAEVVKRNSENMVQTIERAYWAGIVGGTNVQRLTDDVGGVSGAARTDVAGRINAAALDKVIRTLQTADAVQLTDGISASTKIGTQGVRSGYVAVIHPQVKYDLEKVPGYTPKAQYGSMDGVLDGEIGSYKEIRFVASTMCQIFADSGAAVSGTYSTTGTLNDVFINMIFGKNAYACIDLASSAQTFYVPASQVDHANPVGQFSSISWKAMVTSLILNDAWLVRQECAASA